MAIEMVERAPSREVEAGDSQGITQLFYLRGSDDEAAILTHVQANTPTVYPGLGYPRRTIKVKPIGDPTYGTMNWYADVTYEISGGGGSSKAAEDGDSFFNFDTGSTTVRMTNAITTPVKLKAGGGTATDRKNAINESEKGVEGVDIQAGEFRFSETHYFSSTQVTQEYVADLSKLSFTINNGTFRGYAAGEVMFVNAVGSRRGTDTEDGWELSFNFAVIPNIPNDTDDRVKGFVEAGITFGASFPIKGWDYIWVNYKKGEDASASTTPFVVNELYISQIYPYTDFTKLRIGTASFLPND